jgi:transcriptional regulator with XRE-family HTH domain
MINLTRQALLREKNQRKRARMGYKIHAARIAQKMTQTDLANLVGVSQVRISEIERGVGARRKGVVEQIKKALNMSTNKKVPTAFFDKVGKGTPNGERLRGEEILKELNRGKVLAQKRIDDIAKFYTSGTMTAPWAAPIAPTSLPTSIQTPQAIQNKRSLDDKVAVAILCSFGIVLLLLFVN